MNKEPSHLLQVEGKAIAVPGEGFCLYGSDRLGCL